MTEIQRAGLGSTGIPVSRFFFGAGSLGGIGSRTGPGIGVGEDDFEPLLLRALAAGINVIDTADVYGGGASERILGRWLSRHPDAGLLIQTKTGATPAGPDLSPARLRARLESSRQALGRVDLFLPHVVDPRTPWSDSLPVLSDAVDQGLIRAYGLSNVTEADLHAALETADRLAIRRPSLIQNEYSLLARADDAGVLPLARAESIGYTAYSPMAAGLLTGRYSNGEKPGSGSRISVARRALELLEDPATLDKIRRFDQVAARNGLTSAALALAWIISRPGVTAAIVAPSKPAQWAAVVDSAGVAWTTELDDAVAEAFVG